MLVAQEGVRKDVILSAAPPSGSSRPSLSSSSSSSGPAPAPVPAPEQQREWPEAAAPPPQSGEKRGRVDKTAIVANHAVADEQSTSKRSRPAHSAKALPPEPEPQHAPASASSASRASVVSAVAAAALRRGQCDHAAEPSKKYVSTRSKSVVVVFPYTFPCCSLLSICFLWFSLRLLAFPCFSCVFMVVPYVFFTFLRVFCFSLRCPCLSWCFPYFSV